MFPTCTIVIQADTRDVLCRMLAKGESDKEEYMPQHIALLVKPEPDGSNSASSAFKTGYAQDTTAKSRKIFQLSPGLTLNDYEDNAEIFTSQMKSPRTAVTGPAVVCLRVLMVDDALLNRKMQRQLLIRMSRIGVIHDAVDGSEAVKMVRESMMEGVSPYDLILMDYQMPNMDGGTATRHIREMGHKGMMIGVTGNALPKDIIAFKECGVDDVLIKPIKAMDLSRLISGIIPACV